MSSSSATPRPDRPDAAATGNPSVTGGNTASGSGQPQSPTSSQPLQQHKQQQPVADSASGKPSLSVPASASASVPKRRRKRLPRAWILRSGATFRALREKGRRIHGPHHTLTLSLPSAVPASAPVVPAAEQKPAAAGRRRKKRPGPTKELVAFSTSRRVGNAVVRNRVRRLMREVHRLYLARPLQDRTLLWSARNSAAKLTFAEMKAAMEVLWKRVTRWS